MTHERAKINIHATTPKHRRRQRDLLNHQARVKKLARKRSQKTCGPSQPT